MASLASLYIQIKQWQGFSFSIWMLTNFPELSRRWLENSIIYIIDWAIDNFALSCNRGAGHTGVPVFNVTFISISVWYTCQRVWKLSLFVVVNFDALVQASDIQIERRQVVFLCWEQDSNPSGSQTPNRQQTECPLTNRLSYRGSS